MTMYGIPLAPHEIDALSQAERVLATIEQAESDMEMACDELHKPTLDELDEYKAATTDLWHNLYDLVDMLHNGNQDEIDVAWASAEHAIKRNSDLK